MTCPHADSGAAVPAGHPAVPQETVEEVPIPQPPPTLLLGNFPDVDPSFPARSFQHFAELYGEIVQLQLATRVVFVSSQKLINEVCNEDRFHKDISRTLKEVRGLTGDGLFTSTHEDGRYFKKEPNWWKAHRLLVPAFGPLGIRKMFDDMVDISAQMVQRWDRMGEKRAIDCSDDFTRLAFDTIGLCSFGYRFNEFYSDDAHAFANQMANVLKLSGRRASRTDIENKLHYWEEQERLADVKAMRDLAYEIVEERRSKPKPDANDLLNTMLYAVDRETGETLSQDNIVNNMVTFLVAGHETTSATLSFMWYNLLKNPEKLQKAQQQVDEIVGDGVISLDMLPKLTYVDACVKETLRLNSPISTFSVVPRSDTTLANGKYHIHKGDVISINLKGLHHDPEIWGDDHNEFKPERMLDGKFEALPPHSWLPFGRGLRSCIGRAFAEQEMLINTAMILQRFSPEMSDPTYTLNLKSTLTVKPEGFYMNVRRRPGKTLHTGIPGAVQVSAEKTSQTPRLAPAGDGQSRKARIFFGGNAGTCEGFAQILQTKMSEYGIQGDVASLDSATENLSKDQLNFIITSSYEGKPPDNAKNFVAWLENTTDAGKLKGVEYSVLGVGDHSWANTFHRIPKLVDERLQALGAKPVAAAQFADVKTDLLGPFDDWSEAILKACVGGHDTSDADKPSLKVNIEKDKLAKDLSDDKMSVGCVLKNDELADTSVGPAKKHMDVRLPEGMTYVSGDYLVVQPRNPEEAVRRVMRHFAFSDHTRFSIAGSKKKFLPTELTPAKEFFSDYVELATPITKRQLRTLAKYADAASKGKVEERANDDEAWKNTVTNRYSILDVLEEYAIQLPFESFVDMLLPLTPRQYSISSSPLAPGYADVVSITYDVHSSPALSGHGLFEGVCSTFLSTRRPGDHISCFVRATNVNFRLPSSPETPILMFAAGTGIAPMHAFLQERAAIANAGSRKLGPALLFYGCRDPEKDFLYKDQLAEWEKLNIVTVHAAHSRATAPGTPKYVQDCIWEQRKECSRLFRDGGKIYLCGSAARLGHSCDDICKKIWREYNADKSDDDASEWLQSVKTDRYVSDVY